MSGGSSRWNLRPPQPTGSARSVAIRKTPAGGLSSIVAGGDDRRGIDAAVETPIDLGGVRLKAALRVAMSRVDDVELDQSGAQEPLDLCQRTDEAFALGVAQRLEERAGELVAAPIELGPLG